VRTFEEAIAFQNETGIGREVEGFDMASLAQARLALGQPERPGDRRASRGGPG
jgi:hypothetical protein